MPRLLPLTCVALAMGASACSSGPGRVPVFPDAAARFDGGFLDANPRPDAEPDAGPPDSEVVLYDSGIPPTEHPFTGQFQLQGDQNRLFARETRDRLALIVGAAPFVYEGSISSDGTVDAIGERLVRSGCSTARITGSYQRLSATLFLELTGCLADGTPFSTQLRGGFEQDYDLQFSGIYQLAGVVTTNEFGCYAGPGSVMEMVWAVSMRPGDNTVAIHVAHDLIPYQAVYIGRLEAPSFAFAAIENIYATASASDVSMRGNLTRSGTDAPIIRGTRDVYDPIRQCFFTLAFEGTRVSNF